MLVVTVCTANLCRSPFAEHFLRRCFLAAGFDVDVVSAGVAPSLGRTVPPDWRAIAAGFDLDLGEHVPGPVGPLVGSASLVLTMTAAHARDLVVAYPALVGRLAVLGDVAELLERIPPGAGTIAEVVAPQRAIELLNGVSPNEVADPYRRRKDEQLAIAANLAGLCARLVERWPG